MLLVDLLLAAWVLLGLLYWTGQLAGVVRVVRSVKTVIDQPAPPPATWPKLSVIVPACNEAEEIELALTSLRGQDYPQLEIILIDDRSNDGTGEIIDRAAAEDERVTALHVEELPRGWLGKVHALATGAGRAGGDWLLFSDADVRFTAPGALCRFVAHAEANRLDHLTAAPEMWSSGLGVDMFVSLFLRSFCTQMRLWKVSDPRSAAFIGVGAFNLVRASVFGRTPGFEWLRMEVADDLGLGLMMKRAGGRAAIVFGRGLLGLYWYRSVAQIARGLEKAYASVGQCRLWRMVAVAVASIVVEWSLLAALLPGRMPHLWPAGAVMIALWMTTVVVQSRWAGRSLFSGLLSPLAALLGAVLLVRAGWLGRRRGGVVWRGTLYPGEQLRAGARVNIWRRDRAARA